MLMKIHGHVRAVFMPINDCGIDDCRNIDIQSERTVSLSLR